MPNRIRCLLICTAVLSLHLNKGLLVSAFISDGAPLTACASMVPIANMINATAQATRTFPYYFLLYPQYLSYSTDFNVAGMDAHCFTFNRILYTLKIQFIVLSQSYTIYNILFGVHSTVFLQSNTGATFEGFLLEMREPINSVASLSPSQTETMACNDMNDSALSRTSNASKQLVSGSFTMPPDLNSSQLLHW